MTGGDRARYKRFPPGWDHIKVPTSSRSACRAGLAMYAPCSARGTWLHRVTWAVNHVLGPSAIPGFRRAWQPPTDDDTWSAILAELRSDAGGFDELAIYERPQIERQGLLLLLLRGGSAHAVAKLHYRDSGILRTEFDALRSVQRYQPKTFFVPEPLTVGQVEEWDYLLLAPLSAVRHLPPKNPPLNLISHEISAALGSIDRPDYIPRGWMPMHGDLTPWNLRSLHDRRLVLLDWESVGWGPPGADEVFYRATDAALRGVQPTPVDHEEAVEFWREAVGGWPAGSGRDRLLGPRIKQTLELLAPRIAAVPSTVGRQRPRVLVFAYACEPARGSEPGTGWGLVRTLSEFADCTVLVAPEHIPGIRRWEQDNNAPGLEFVEVSEPRVGRAAKWHRIPWFLVYMSWLRRAYRAAKRLHEKEPFDAVYHATYAVYWLPTPATRFGIPCVWGPVGGAARTPVRLWSLLGLTGVIDEILDLVSVWFGHWLPTTRMTWRNVGSAMIQNEETLDRMTEQVRARSCVLNHVLFVEPPEVPHDATRRPFILFPSSIETRKGPRLAVEAMARTPDDVHLVFASDGPEQEAMKRLAYRLGVAPRIDFRGRVSRDELFELLSQAGGTLFTGLREEGGAALAEAMLCGSPVIVLANGGARTVAAAATDPARVRLVRPGSRSETAEGLASAMTEFSRNLSTARGPILDQRQSRHQFRRSFERAMWSGNGKRG